MRLSICFLCVSVLLLFSCEDEAAKLRRQAEEFTASTVVIPDGIERVNYSDKEFADYRDKETLLIVYIDSVACATCAINGMFQYDGIIEFAESDSLSRFAPLFVFSPRHYQYTDLKRTLHFSGLNSSALLDKFSAFPAANPHIPADSRFHTFLLDKNGKVVLVGDPANNPGLWELYKTTITKLIENDGALPIVEK